MKARAVLVALVLLLAGCGDDGTGGDHCGGVDCPQNAQCDRSVDPPVCRCDQGYTGENCDACAPGYRPSSDGGCEPILIDCQVDPELCGAHGECISGSGGDRCECDEGYAGILCERCADGYQDNSPDRICRPGCEIADPGCESPFICSDADGTPVCACPQGTIGDECEFCQAGYHDPQGEGICYPTCHTANLDCGANGSCDDSSGPAECACLEGYTGADCDQCAPGYQDYAEPGSCRPGCGAAQLDCSGNGHCEDSNGIPHCVCDLGFAGQRCEECAQGYIGAECDRCAGGYFRVGDGPCWPDCSTAGLDCGEHGLCVQEYEPVYCVCEVGWAGDGCQECAPGYSADPLGVCAAQPAGDSLLGLGRIDLMQYAWVAFDPGTDRATPLRPTLQGRYLAADVDSGALYGLASGSLYVIDLVAGESTLVVATGNIHDEGLTWDPVRNLLWTAASGGLRSIDPLTGDTGFLSADYFGYEIDLAYRAATDRIYLNSPSGLYVIDPGSGAVENRFTIDPVIYHTSEASPGIAFARGTDELYAISPRYLTDEEASGDICRQAAAGLGLDGYEEAPVSVHVGPIDPGSTLELHGGSGPEMVVYSSIEEAAGELSTLEVRVDNPEALVCIGIYREPLLLRFAAGARFRAAAVSFSHFYGSTLEVQDGFETPAQPNVHLVIFDDDSIGPSVYEYPEVIRLYTTYQWQDRRLPSVFDLEKEGDGILVQLNPDTGETIRIVDLPGLWLGGTLTPI